MQLILVHLNPLSKSDFFHLLIFVPEIIYTLNGIRKPIESPQRHFFKVAHISTSQMEWNIIPIVQGMACAPRIQKSERKKLICIHISCRSKDVQEEATKSCDRLSSHLQCSESTVLPKKIHIQMILNWKVNNVLLQITPFYCMYEVAVAITLLAIHANSATWP